jgi:hypothetical protein
MLSGAWSSAAVGDVAAAVLIPLSKQGKLRVTYDWLYSSLNCDPGDNSDFIWLLTKVDDGHIALSPRDQHEGRQLYASVRDDWNWNVQVQAPFSADWITAVGRDEILGIEGEDLLVISLRGFNGQYVTVNGSAWSYDGHTGFRLQSLSGGDPNARTFFMGVTEVLQDGLDLPLRPAVTADRIRAALADSATDDLVDYLHRSLG